MSLTKEASTQLWDSVKEHNFTLFNPINQKLLNPQGVNLRHIPIKLYLPHAPSESQDKETVAGSLRVVQTLTPTSTPDRRPQTLGTALKQALPTLFVSERRHIHAQPVLHGASVQLSTNLEELLRFAAYSDGWLHIAIVMMG